MRKKRAEKGEKQSLREKIADSFEASKEIVLDVPKIVMIGNREAVIENYKGISEYTPQRIVLEANPRSVRITGEELEIKSVTQEMIFVAGVIDSMGFVKEG